MIKRLRTFQARAAIEDITVQQQVAEHISSRQKATYQVFMPASCTNKRTSSPQAVKAKVTETKSAALHGHLSPTYNKQWSGSTVKTAASSSFGDLAMISIVGSQLSAMQDRIRTLLAESCRDIYQDRIRAIRRKHKLNSDAPPQPNDTESKSEAASPEPSLYMQHTFVMQQSPRKNDSLKKRQQFSIKRTSASNTAIEASLALSFCQQAPMFPDESDCASQSLESDCSSHSQESDIESFYTPTYKDTGMTVIHECCNES